MPLILVHLFGSINLGGRFYAIYTSIRSHTFGKHQIFSQITAPYIHLMIQIDN